MRIIRLKEVMDLTGLARSTIYKFISGDLFPKPISLGDRCVGWLESEVHDWILSKVKERDQLVENDACGSAAFAFHWIGSS